MRWIFSIVYRSLLLPPWPQVLAIIWAITFIILYRSWLLFMISAGLTCLLSRAIYIACKQPCMTPRWQAILLPCHFSSPKSCESVTADIAAAARKGIYIAYLIWYSARLRIWFILMMTRCAVARRHQVYRHKPLEALAAHHFAVRRRHCACRGRCRKRAGNVPITSPPEARGIVFRWRSATRTIFPYRFLQVAAE